MLVADRMSKPVKTIAPDLPIQEALNRMRAENIRRFPVVNGVGKLVGIVSESDLLHAAPSNATSLSVWELTYLMTKITVDQLMTQEVVTIEENTPIEEAARLMADQRIGGLPVVKDGKVVGIITETDLFKLFVEQLGARADGVRLTVQVPNVPGVLADVTKTIYEIGGDIIALGTFEGETDKIALITLKVAGVDAQKVSSAIESHVERIVDIRTIKH